MDIAQKSVPQPGFEPNFEHTYSVTIDKPYEEVFRTIGTPDGHDRVTKLSKFCSEYTPLQNDEVLISSEDGLQDIAVGKAEPNANPLDPLPSNSRILSRQSFKLVESIPVLFGLFHTTVPLDGTICWDEAAGVSLYESESNNFMHIKVWKCRKFEREGDNKVKVTETIKGKCPSLIQKIVQEQARSVHTSHMDAYCTLF